MTKNNNFDLIIMDVMMPVMDGVSALKEMQKIGIETPVILLTAKSSTDDKVEGLDNGAEDYLTKPFETKELLARIRKIFRNNKNEKVTFGNVTFNKEISQLSNDTKTFELNKEESKIIEILIKNQDRKVSETEMIGRLFQKEDKNASESLNMYLSFLKDKLFALDADFKIDSKDGYILQKL